MKNYKLNVKFSNTEQEYWLSELKNNRKFFLLMYFLIIIVELVMGSVLYVTNSIATLPNYNVGYFSYYLGGIMNAIVSMFIIYYSKHHVRIIQIVCLCSLMIWACLFTVYDVQMGANGYVLSQILVLAATSIRFPGRIHFTIHFLVFCLYICLLAPLNIDLNVIVSNIVNTGLLFFFASLIIVYSNRIRIQNFKNTKIMEKQQKQLLHMTQYDGLTGLHSRTTILNYMEDLLSKNKKIGCIMSDIDDFKRYNDLYGHRTGDEVLRQTALLLNKTIQSYGGKAGRYGGEEFLVVIDDCDQEKLKDILHDLQINFQEPADEHTITLSMGGTLILENDSIDSIISRADKAMYRAKHAGKHTFRIL